jgi:hypothetical protein
MSMKDILKWQLRKLTGELLLLQAHASDLSCPCELSTELENFCQPKHLIAIQAYAEETIAMTEDARLKDTLSGIAGAANDLRRAYEESPEDKRPYADIAQFARDARKAIEPYLFRYKQPAALKQEEPRWCLLKQPPSGCELAELVRAKCHSLSPWKGQKGCDAYVSMLYEQTCNKEEEEKMKAELKASITKFTPVECKRLDATSNYLSAAQRELSQLLVNKRLWKDKEVHSYHWDAYNDIQAAQGRLERHKVLFCERGEETKAELRADPLLTEIASQLCTGGVCFARSDKTDRLPICSPSEAEALERCIIKVKAKQPKYCEKEWHKPPEEMRKGCYNPWATCRASVGCRLGGTEEYEERIS